MTQEEKELLLKDLCSRLPYGVKVYRKWIAPLSESPEEGVFDFCIFDIEILLSQYNWVSTEKGIREVREYDIKPYLFPLSSMTEEQKKEYNRWKHEIPVCYYEYGDVVEEIELYDSPESFEYLIENHFDYRGLIEKGLAIDCTNLNVY